MKWPGDENPIFSLTSAYVPDKRSNLAAYMAVNADASSPDYGRMRILQMSDTSQIDGPGQSFNAMTTNETVADRLRPFLNQGAASATFGNLLTLPVGGGLLYVTPVYTQRQGSTGSYPALRFVVVRFGQSVGIGDTLQQALDQVFQGSSGGSTGEKAVPTRASPRVRPTTRPRQTRSARRGRLRCRKQGADRGRSGTYQKKMRKPKPRCSGRCAHSVADLLSASARRPADRPGQPSALESSGSRQARPSPERPAAPPRLCRRVRLPALPPAFPVGAPLRGARCAGRLRRPELVEGRTRGLRQSQSALAGSVQKLRGPRDRQSR